MKRNVLSELAANASADAVAAILAGGRLCIYDGDQPEESAGEPLAPIVEFELGEPAFGAAKNGLATAHQIEPAIAARSGDAAWFRAFTALDEPVLDGSVGATDADLVLDSANIQAKDSVSIEYFAYRQPLKSGAK